MPAHYTKKGELNEMLRTTKLAIPVHAHGKIYTEVDVKEPTSGAVANMKREADKGNLYAALLSMSRDCVVEIRDVDGGAVTEKKERGEILRKMPYRSHDQVIIDALLANGQDSGTEGVYPCPRCSEKIIAERRVDKETGEVIEDTLDYLDTLPVIFSPEEEEPVFAVELSDMVEIPGHGPVLGLKFRYPTIGDCVTAFKRVGGKDSAKLQFSIFREALIAVDGVEVDLKWKNRWGDYLFTHFVSAKRDLNAISEMDNRYGIQYGVERVCPECGKEFVSEVDTSNFFASALPSSKG